MAGRNTATRDQHRNAIRRERPPCGICREAIDYSLPHLDPMSFVADHVIPLAKGGEDTLENKQAAHRLCNEAKGDRMHAIEGRRVVLVCGPPGGGKTTFAHTLGLTVFDVDDPQWCGNEALFSEALRSVGANPEAQAAVIRSAPTLAARKKAARLCGATDIRILTTDLDVCIAQINHRGRTSPPIKTQIAAARDWWSRYEPGEVSSEYATTARQFVTSRSW